MDDSQMTVAQAASRLGVTTRTVRLWIASGKLSGESVRGRFGPEWRISAEEVGRLLNEKPETALVIDMGGKLGGNDFRAYVSALYAENSALQGQMSDNLQSLANLAARLDHMASSLKLSEAQLDALRTQSLQLQRMLAEAVGAQQREGREIQVRLQGVGDLLHGERETLDVMKERLEAISRPRLRWWQRLRRNRGE